MRKVFIVLLSLLLIVWWSDGVNELRNERENEQECLEVVKDAYENRDTLIEEERVAIQVKLKNNKYIEAVDLFLQGYIELEDNQIDKAEKSFQQSIDLSNLYTPQFIKVYSHKLLSDIKIEKGLYKEAYQLTERAFEEIHKAKCSNDYKAVWDVLSPMLKLPEGNQYVTEVIEYIIQNEDRQLDEEARMYFYRKLTSLYALKLDYSNAINTSIKMLEFIDNPDNHYYIAKTLVDIAVIAKSLGANEIALEILENMSLDIDNTVKVADFEVYKLLNIAENNIVIEKYSEATQALEKIKEYEKYLPKWKQAKITNIKNIRYAEIAIKEKNIELAKSYLEKIKKIEDIGQKISYEGIKGDYIRVLAHVYQEEGDYTRAKKLYNEIIRQEIKATDYEDFSDAIKGLIEINRLEGNDELSLYYINILEKLQKDNTNKNFKIYYKYMYNNYYYKMVKKENENIEYQNIVYSLMTIVSVGGIVIFVFSPMIKDKKRKKEIQKYMKQNNYYLVYQPIVDPRKNRIIGVEALLRLKIKDKIIYPNHFIPQIEEVKMMKEVSLWVLKQIKSDYKVISELQDLENEFYISMNVSLNEIQDKNFVEQLKVELGTEIDSRCKICLEITENMGTKDTECIREHIEQLIESDFKIAVDDFGVDYSNISRLEQFKFHTLKLDKYFIDNINSSRIVQAMIKVINELSREVDISIVIEGVEEEWQKELIRELESKKFYIQGYYYSKPLELERLVAFRLNE